MLDVEEKPLSKSAKLLSLLTIFGIVLLWAIGIYAYVNLPNVIPTHFAANGKPNAYGSKNVFLILPACFSIAPVILLINVKFRYTLIKKYPYLLNLPAFFANLNKLPKEKQGEFVNMYFELILIIALILTYLFVGLEYWIYIGTIRKELGGGFVAVIIISIVLLIAVIFAALRRMSKKFEKELKHGLD